MQAVLHLAAAKAEGTGGFIAEFGVHKGHSIRELAAAFPGRGIHGFDSFEGFPSDGREDWQQDFSVPVLPEVPGSVTLHKGFFEETVPSFAAGLPKDQQADFLHIDCDIYSSARTIFETLGERIRPGTVLLFDELVNYDEFLGNEMLVLYEWTRASGLGVQWLATKGKLRPLKEYTVGVEGGFVGYRQQRYYQNAGLVVREDPERDAREVRFLDEARELVAFFGDSSGPFRS
nr:class I SAM-dependent methyltransferase [Parvularcula mediterranea]